MSFLDDAIGFFSPQAQFKREQYRAMTQALQQRKYDAAGSGRRFDGWHSSGTSAGAETMHALSKLRNRSRALVRNNPWAWRAIRVMANNTVGTGIRLSVVGDDAAVKVVKDEWRDWAEDSICHHGEQLNFYGIEMLVARTIFESGEAFIIRKRNNNRIPFAIEILEGDYCDHNYNVAMLDKGKGYIKEGIQFDVNGKRTGYWMYSEHPGEALSLGTNITPKFVPAADVIHAYEILRPGQNRGIPAGVSSMLRLNDFGDYEDAQLIKQKISACLTAFVTESGGDSTLPGTKGPDGGLTERLEPGLIQKLPVGTEVSFSNPPNVDGYGDYSHNMLMGAAVGFDTSYEMMSGDFSRVNFASGRMGRLDFNQVLDNWQENVMINMLCKGVVNWFVEALKMRGKISENARIKSQWTVPARVMVDITKETKACKDAIRGGLTSWSDAVRAQGYDPDELLAEIAADKAKWDNLGITLDIDVALEYLQKKKEAKVP